MPYTADNLIMPALMALHECLCAELVKSGLDAGCECALLHGAAVNVAPPAVGKGYAWVSLESIFPSKSFPNPDSGANNCPSPLAALVIVGVLRCFPVKPTGESADDMLLYMDKQMADMAAMRRAILCCASIEDDVQLGSYTPIGPEGGIYGGSWTVSLGQSSGS